MSRVYIAGGLAAVLMGVGLTVPVIATWLERDRLTGLGIGILVAAACLVTGGIMGAVLGVRRGPGEMPSGVRAAVAANALALAFLALELSDRSIRQDGKLFYWTTFLLPPALLLFCGLLAARRWSWWAARGTAAIGAVWFLGFMAIVPFATLKSDGVPAPWYGRLYMAGVTLAFACMSGCAYWSLGQSETRRYFGLLRTAK